MRKDILIDVDELFAEDMKNPEYVNKYKAEMNHLASAVAIREERDSYGWTREQLAKEAGIPQSTVARVETGANTSKVVPITTNTKDFPLHVSLPDGLAIHGKVELDHKRTIDIMARDYNVFDKVPDD